MPDLTVDYLGFSLKNPFIVSSSGFTRTVAGIEHSERAGASAVVMKSLFEEEIRAASKDVAQSEYFHAEVMEYLRSEVELEYHAEKYFETIRNAKKSVDIPVIASLNATTSKWWIQYARSIENAGADALELNLYFIDIDDETRSEELEEKYLETIREVKNSVKIPIAVKLSRYFTALPGLVKAIRDTGVEGVVLFNRFIHPEIDLDTLTIKSASFLADPVGFHYALRWISYLSGNSDIQIAASGGVQDYTHFVKYLLAGAKVVESCSVLYEKGIDYISVILKDLEQWMEKSGFDRVRDLIGKVNTEQNIAREEYLRAQFVKTVLDADVPFK